MKPTRNRMFEKEPFLEQGFNPHEKYISANQLWEMKIHVRHLMPQPIYLDEMDK